jgi:hypothetical protein
MNLRIIKIIGRSVVGVALVFALSFASLLAVPQQVNADQCSINGRDCYFGYFFNGYDGGPPATGTRFNLLTSPALLNVHGANDLINNLGADMACVGGRLPNPNDQNSTGAAFIVLTMMGYAPGTSKDVACQIFGQWAQRVVDWAPYTDYDRFYDFGGLNTRSTRTDVAYYPSAQTTAWSIVFNDPNTGAPLYAIKKDCGNPVGHLQALPDRPYSLTPHVNSISPPTIEAGNSVSISTSVDNTGSIASRPTQWEITEIVVQPGKQAPHEGQPGTTSGTAPCQTGGGAPSGDYFVSADATCSTANKGSGSFDLGTPAQNLKPSLPPGFTIGDLPVGTRVCFALSVQPHSNTDAGWAHSPPVCAVVGKKPKIQVWGGDIAVRGQIDTSTSSKGANIFGSWVEYGAFSVGPNKLFASGSGTNGQTNNSQTAWSKLTFANKDATGADVFGNYTSAAGFRPLPTVAGYFATAHNQQPVGAGSVDIGSLAFTTGDPVRVRTAGNLVITGGSIPAGKSVVILATGTVSIEGNINYTNATLNGVGDIPQVVIIAQDINIKDTVTNVDAWLVASGTINTCNNFVGNLTSNKCGSALVVNGPVITDKLILNRTAGTGTGAQSGDPAEQFNLRPDAFLWAQLEASGNNKAQTVYSQELPPRF